MQLHKNEFYVYFIKLEEEIIYIGKGRKYRYLQSKLKFAKMYPNEIITHIIYKNNLSELEAYVLEESSIKNNSTRHNKNKTTIGLCRDTANIERKNTTRGRIIAELLSFIEINNKYPSRYTEVGSEEYRLCRRIEAYSTKTNGQYDEELRAIIINVRHTFRKKLKNSKELDQRNKKLLRESKREKTKKECLDYAQRTGRIPDKGHKDLYNYIMFHYYPSSEKFDSRFRMDMLIAIDTFKEL
jgi:hypothetical protein